jgi:hypothetical protein
MNYRHSAAYPTLIIVSSEGKVVTKIPQFMWFSLPLSELSLERGDVSPLNEFRQCQGTGGLQTLPAKNGNPVADPANIEGASRPPLR